MTLPFKLLGRLRIGPKLLLAPGVVLVLLVLLSAGTYLAMLRQNDAFDTIVRQRALHMRAASSLVASAQRAHAQAYQILTWISGSFPRTRTEPLVLEVRTQHAAIAGGFAALAGLARATPASQREAELRDIRQAAAAWKLYVAAVGDVIEIAREDQSISANAMARADRAFGLVAARLAELARREQELAQQALDQAAAEFRLVAGLIPAGVLLAVLVSLGIAMAVRRSLLDEIGAIESAASRLASGDLRLRPRVEGEDEIASTSRALDDGIRSLNQSLRAILESARSIGSASREIALGRAGLPARPSVRASLELTATSVQDLAGAMLETSISARQAKRLSEAALDAAQQGESRVHRLVATLEQLRRAASRLDRLGASMELAGGRTAGQAHAKIARELAREAAAAIEAGTGMALDAGASMALLSGSVQAVGEIVHRIGCASATRAENLAGVNQAIVRMDELTRQGTRMVEDAALAARTLQQQALGLSQAVAAFRLDEAAQAGPAADHENGAGGAPCERPGSPGHPYLRLASSRGGKD